MGLPFCITFCHHLICASRAHSFHCFYYDPTVHIQCVRLLNDMRLSLSEKIPRRRFFSSTPRRNICNLEISFLRDPVIVSIIPEMYVSTTANNSAFADLLTDSFICRDCGSALERHLLHSMQLDFFLFYFDAPNAPDSISLPTHGSCAYFKLKCKHVIFSSKKKIIQSLFPPILEFSAKNVLCFLQHKQMSCIKVIFVLVFFPAIFDAK